MPVQCVCLGCSKTFSVSPCEAQAKYCSKNCANHSDYARAERSQRTKAAWQDKEKRKRLADGIKRRSESDEWKSAPHFQRGEKHPRWKGGKRNQREKEMSNYPYKVWRTAVFKRDDYTCQNCGVRGVFLIAHHIKHWSEYPELRYEIDNGVTLCETCHDKQHGWERGKRTAKCVVCGKKKPLNRSPKCRSCANRETAKRPRH